MKKLTFKKLISVLLCFMLILTSFPTMAFASDSTDYPTDGKCGNNLTWKYDSNTKTLTINGQGEMYNWRIQEQKPWSIHSSSINNIIVEDGVTSIGDSAFFQFLELTSVQLPNSITNIGDYSFGTCKKLINIYMPESITNIGQNAFNYCANLKSINLPSTLKSIGASAFSACYKLESIKIPNGVKEIKNETFYECFALKIVDIPDSVERIGNYAFFGCESLEKIELSNNIYYIDFFAFGSCKNLKTINLPEQIKIIKYFTFYNCSNLENIVVPEGLTAIDERAFKDCTSLKSITIPDSVNEIYIYAFENCTNLSDVYYQGTNLQWQNINISDHNENLLYANIHFKDTQDNIVELPAYTEKYTKKLVEYNSFTKMASFSDGTVFTVSSELEDSINSSLNKWVSIEITVLTSGKSVVSKVNLIKSQLEFDIKMSDTRNIYLKDNKYSYDKVNYKKSSDFDIGFEITISNCIYDVSKEDLEKMKTDTSLDITLKDFYIISPDGFNFGWTGNGKPDISSIVLHAGETYNVTGFVRAGIFYFVNEQQVTEGIRAYIKSDSGQTETSSAAFTIINLDYNNKLIEDIEDYAKEAEKQLDKLNVDENIALDFAVMSSVFGIEDEDLETFKKEMLIAIIMSSAPPETFKDVVEQSSLEKVFGKLQTNVTANGYIVPLKYVIDTPKYGKLVVTFNCNVTEFGLNNSKFALNAFVGYEILQKEKNVPSYLMVNNALGLISFADIESFKDAAYNLAEEEIKQAYNDAWGGTADEIAEILLGDAVKFILKQANISVSDFCWKLMTWPTKQIENACPTNVYIYNSSGELCGAIENNIITKNSTDFELSVNGDVKYIKNIDDSYNIKYLGTDNGTMNVNITEFIGDKQPFRSISFKNVPLQRNINYVQDISTEILSPSESYNLISSDNVIVSADTDELILDLKQEDYENSDYDENVYFYDVSENAYYYDAVVWAIKNSIAYGTSDTIFSPDKPCTRAQFVVFLWRANGSPQPLYENTRFKDISVRDYYYKAVQWAVEKNIVNGTSYNTFTPNQFINRSQAITFLWRANGSPKVNKIITFSDVSSNAFYTEAVKWAIYKNLTTGESYNLFAPNKNCTRAQSITFLYRNMH